MELHSQKKGWLHGLEVSTHALRLGVHKYLALRALCVTLMLDNLCIFFVSIFDSSINLVLSLQSSPLSLWHTVSYLRMLLPSAIQWNSVTPLVEVYIVSDHRINRTEIS